MQEAKAAVVPGEKQPSIPARLEHIEEQMKALHEIADRMRPSADAQTEQVPNTAGLEAVVDRVEASAQGLIHRFTAVADKVGQL